MIKIFSFIFLITILTSGANARDQIRVVGSSTVYPFTTVVAEAFGRDGLYQAPLVESTGTGGGFKLFCAGVGIVHPDVSNASRAIKEKEITKCKNNGITPVEFKIGYDGIVMANSKEGPRFSLTTKQVFLALAKLIPVDGVLVENPYKKWNEIDSSLPDLAIEVMGPPPTSGTRDAFVELAMEGGAKQFPMLKAMKKENKKKFKAAAHGIREDGAYIEAGENDNLIIQKLKNNPNALGIFGYSFLDNNSDTIQGSDMNGVEPTFDLIAAGEYPVSRALYVYIKKEHADVVPGLKDFVRLYLSDDVIGQDGMLSERGLIPMTDNELAGIRTLVLENVVAAK